MTRERIPIAQPAIEERECELVMDAMRSGWVSSGGKYVAEFEKKFSDFCGVKYGVAVMNGTVALHLALVVAGVGKGDEVIVPSLSYVATANAVSYVGAKPVFVDSEEITWNLNPKKIEEKINRMTKVIIPVHLYGHPADMDPILDIARRYKLLVIEDAAEAHGALYKGRPVGSLGQLGCFSFFGNKIITTGEGGMVVTNKEEFREKLMFFRNQGQDSKKRYWHTDLGFNYRMTNLQAALGVAQTEKLPESVRRKREIAMIYSRYLEGVSGLTLPPNESWAESVFWMYSVLINGDRAKRDKIIDFLEKDGIETRPFFYPVHTMPHHSRVEKYPVAEELSARGINLPSSVVLSEGDIEFVTLKLKDALRFVY